LGFKGAKRPLYQARGLIRAHEAFGNASIIEYLDPPSAAALPESGQTLCALIALHRLDLLLAFNVNYMYRA
jgi:hypothetical protein